MAVYHFTLHAYRSWSPSHPRGYTRKGKGYQPPDPQRAAEYDGDAKFSKVSFDRRLQEILVLGSYDICRRRRWRLHAVGTDPSHVHLVVSWRKYIPWHDVMTKLKNILSLLLGRITNSPGRRWFVVNGSRKRVSTKDHLDHLLREYLPCHRGLFWCEGRALPLDKYGVLGEGHG